MIYVSIDELDRFSFHDARIEGIEWNNQSMKWITKSLNAAKENTQNSYPKDMCIKAAEVVFEMVEIKGIRFPAYDVFSSDNQLIRHEEAHSLHPSAYMDTLKDAVSSSCWIFGLHLEQTPEGDNLKYEAIINSLEILVFSICKSSLAGR